MDIRSRFSSNSPGSHEELAQHLSRAQLELTYAQQKIALLERELAARRYNDDVLQINTAKLRLILKQLPVMIWTGDSEGRITSWAGSGPAGGDLEQGQIVGQTLQSFFGTNDPGFAPVAAALRAREGQVSDATFRWRDRPYLLAVEPIWSRTGAAMGHVAIAVDLMAPGLQSSTEPAGTAADQELEARKVEAVSRLAGGVAHEFNNILTGIVGYADLWKLRAKPSDPAIEAIETIQQGAARATKLTHQLLGYARRGKNQSVPVDLTALLREVLAEKEGDLAEQHVRTADGPLQQAVELPGDPQQWREVFRALLQNAIEAMPKGGRLSVSSESIELPEAVSQPDANLPAGRYAQITIRDTGTGIPAAVLPRVLEPFYSFGRGDKNLGLGLAYAYGVTRNHGGGIVIDSAPGSGTEVHLLFPAPKPTAKSLPSQAPVVTLRHAQVIVVDDEAYVRMALEQMLLGLGYRVRTFEECHAAVDYYRRHGEDVDLVIMDLVMPRSSGKACFAAFQAINPDVKAILASGFGQDGAVQDALNLGMKAFLQKPFQLQTLAQTVAQALADEN